MQKMIWVLTINKLWHKQADWQSNQSCMNMEYVLVSFLESLLSLKKSRLLQLLDNQEEGLSSYSPGNSGGKNTVSQ